MSLYRLFIVLAINGIYTKPGIFGHRPVCRLSIISPIVISKLSFASVYGTICTKSVVIAHKNSYKQPLYFGIYRPVCRLSIISTIVISKLSFASVYGTICTKSVVIAHKNSYKQPLYFGIPGVLVLQTPVTADIVPIAN